MVTLKFNLMPNFKYTVSIDEEKSVKDLKQLLLSQIKKNQPRVLEIYGDQLKIYCGRELKDDEVVKNINWTVWNYSNMTVHKKLEVKSLQDQAAEVLVKNPSFFKPKRATEAAKEKVEEAKTRLKN